MSHAKCMVLATLTTALLASSLSAVAGATTTEPFVRGVYGRDSSPTGTASMEAAGFNSVTVSAYKVYLDELQAQGLKGLVWLGSYSNVSCSWERDDSWVRTRIAEVAGHPAILAYQLGDEPNARVCPQAPQQMRERNALVKSLDSTHDTYSVVSAWNGVELYPYEDFAGITDIMGLDVYPCNRSASQCNFDSIGAAVAEATKDGVTRYWAIIQAFSDDYYRMPTANEVREQFNRWAGSNMEGYFLYSWEYGAIEKNPEVLNQVTIENSQDPSVVTGPSTSPSPSTPPSGETKRPPRKVRWRPSGKGSVVLSWRTPLWRNPRHYVVTRNRREVGRTRGVSIERRVLRPGRNVFHVRAVYRSGRSPARKVVVRPCSRPFRREGVRRCR